MLKGKKPETTFELCPEGTHEATIYKIIHIGTLESEWQGKKKIADKIRIYFELPNEPKTYEIEKDGVKQTVETVHSISAKYTLSMGEKAKLRPIVTGIIGKAFANDDEAWDFDVSTLLGKSCLLNVVHEASKQDASKKYAVIKGTTPLLKNMKKPEPVLAQEFIDVNTADEATIDKLHQTIKDEMKSSKEWIARMNVEENEILIDGPFPPKK